MRREARPDCSVRKGQCNAHNRDAKRITNTMHIVTRNIKAGLYSYLTKKQSVLHCGGSFIVLNIIFKPKFL